MKPSPYPLTHSPPLGQISPERLLLQRVWRNTAVCWGGGILLFMTFLAIAAPWLGTVDPTLFDTNSINTRPWSEGTMINTDGESEQHFFIFGADPLGRDIYSRVLYGARISLSVGLWVAVFALLLGTTIGLLAGSIRWLDNWLMRFMDGLMAIPGILVAIALITLWKASLLTVVLAITIPEIPRVARLVRSLALSIREEPYVEAAIALGTSFIPLLFRHILPNTVAPLLVQGTYVAASAMLTEAILGFLGLGLSSEIPTWGNIMAEGRVEFTQYPHNMIFPGMILALTILAVNIMGDGLRDELDPKQIVRR